MTWISVKDLLPGLLDDKDAPAPKCLVVVDEATCVGWFTLRGWYYEPQFSGRILQGKITHWQPFPEPPNSIGENRPPESYEPRIVYWEPDRRLKVYYAGELMEWEDFRKINEPKHQYAEC